MLEEPAPTFMPLVLLLPSPERAFCTDWLPASPEIALPTDFDVLPAKFAWAVAALVAVEASPAPVATPAPPRADVAD